MTTRSREGSKERGGILPSIHPSGFYAVNGTFETLCTGSRLVCTRVCMYVCTYACIGYIQSLWKRKVQRYCRGGHEWAKEWKVETSVPIHNVGNARNPE